MPRVLIGSRVALRRHSRRRTALPSSGAEHRPRGQCDEQASLPAQGSDGLTRRVQRLVAACCKDTQATVADGAIVVVPRDPSSDRPTGQGDGRPALARRARVTTELRAPARLPPYLKLNRLYGVAASYPTHIEREPSATSQCATIPRRRVPTPFPCQTFTMQTFSSASNPWPARISALPIPARHP